MKLADTHVSANNQFISHEGPRETCEFKDCVRLREMRQKAAVDETAKAERSNLIEKMAEAILYAWMHTDRSTIMPDRSAADYALDSQEWADFWQSLGIQRRNVYRAQAEAALKASELDEKVAKLQAAIDGIREADLRWRNSSAGLYMAWPTIRSIIDSVSDEG